jgi:hypothetical protein
MASDYVNHQKQSTSNPHQISPDPDIQEENEGWNVDNWNNEVYKFEQNSLIKNKLGLIVNKRLELFLSVFMDF